jgi:protein-tyrosine phosphatase
MASWQNSGVSVVLSLLTKDEEAELDLAQEARQASAHGMKFLSYPIPDLQVPDSENRLSKVLDQLNAKLESCKNAVVHCRQGIGRTGLVAACLLVSKGIDPAKAIQDLSTARGISVPETAEQRKWIEHYGATLPSSR